MSDVQYTLLSDVLLPPISGSRPSGGVSSDTDGIPSVGGENIVSTGGMIYEELKRIPASFFKFMPKGKLQPDDVLINKDGAQTGKVGIYEGTFDEAAINEHIFILRGKDENVIEQRYLYYCILLPETRNKIDKRITGSAQPGLNSQFVKAVDIPLREILKQRKISCILKTTDQAIENTEALIHKYHQIKTGLMHDLFTRGLDADGKLRPPSEQAPEMYKETPIGWIPKEWDYEPVGIAMESFTDGPFGSNLKTKHYVMDPGVRVVRLQNIHATEYNDHDKAYISERHANHLLRNKVVSGDILIAGLGEEKYPVGRSCQYPEDLPFAVNKADCFKLKCRPDDYDNFFRLCSGNRLN